MIKVLFNFFTISAFCAVSAASIGDALKSIVDQPDYFRPAVTILGTATNSGWYQSASIDKKFGFNFSIPISATYLATKDAQYSSTYETPNCPTCPVQDYTAPTIFGTINTPNVHVYQRDFSGNIVDSTNSVPFTGALIGLKVIPLLFPQLGFSLFHTELKFRYIGIPTPIGLSINMPAFGIQHDFQYLFPENFPISLSLAFNMTLISANWELNKFEKFQNENISGTISVSGTTNFLGAVAGYKIGKLMEIFLETGWEHSVLKVSGEMNTVVKQVPETTPLDTKLTGRNAFRAALNVAFALGPYRPVIGGIAGVEFGNNVNIISFKSKIKED